MLLYYSLEQSEWEDRNRLYADELLYEVRVPREPPSPQKKRKCHILGDQKPIAADLLPVLWLFVNLKIKTKNTL